MRGDPLYPPYEEIQRRISVARRDRSIALGLIMSGALRHAAQILRRTPARLSAALHVGIAAGKGRPAAKIGG